MEMMMVIMAATQDQMGNLPAVLWHRQLHLPGVKMPANDPSSLASKLYNSGVPNLSIVPTLPLIRSLPLQALLHSEPLIISKTAARLAALGSEVKHSVVAGEHSLGAFINRGR